MLAFALLLVECYVASRYRWVPGEDDGFLRVDISRAVAAGISFRPLEETARDTLAWSLEAGEQRPTLSREKEREILASA